MRVKRRLPAPVALPERWLLATTAAGEMRVRVPEGGRVTFGPDVFEEKAREQAGDRRVYSLRIYRGKGNDTLCAVVPHVIAFRDEDIDLGQVYHERRMKSGILLRAVAQYGPQQTGVPSHYDVWQRSAKDPYWRLVVTALEPEVVSEQLERIVAAGNRLQEKAS